MDPNATFARTLLKITFGLVPIVAGLDKFFNLLTDWNQYVPKFLADILPIGTGTLLAIVGIIEIAAGILVFIRTRLGAYVVSAWLVLIALSLISTGDYLVIAVSDFVMAIAALSLAKLSEAHSRIPSASGKASSSLKNKRGHVTV